MAITSTASATTNYSESMKVQAKNEDPLAKATANLEKQAAKLTERAGQNISSGERQRIDASLKAINDGLKGLAAMRAERGGGTTQTPGASAPAQQGNSSGVTVQISDKAKAEAKKEDPLARATANLEKQAAKLTERAGQNISSGERQRIDASLKAINDGLKGLASMRAERDGASSSQMAGAAGQKGTSAPETASQKTKQSTTETAAAASGNSSTAAAKGKTETPARTKDPMAAALENMTRKNDAARAALNGLEKAYGGGAGTVSSRLSLVA